jgi:hypothetical protein
MNCKGFGRKRSWPNIKVLSWHLYAETEKKKTTKKPLSGYPVSGSKFEARTSRMPSRSVNHSTMKQIWILKTAEGYVERKL